MGITPAAQDRTEDEILDAVRTMTYIHHPETHLFSAEAADIAGNVLVVYEDLIVDVVWAAGNALGSIGWEGRDIGNGRFQFTRPEPFPESQAPEGHAA